MDRENELKIVSLESVSGVRILGSVLEGERSLLLLKYLLRVLQRSYVIA